MKATLFVEQRRLEAVGRNPDGPAPGGFNDSDLQQPSSDAKTTMDLIDPELFDLGRTRPTVAADRAYLCALRIERHECQPFTVIRSSCTAIVVIEPILQAVDVGYRQIVTRYELHLHAGHAPTS